jgi:hypothetical protein
VVTATSLTAAAGNCSFYDGWRDQLQVPNTHFMNSCHRLFRLDFWFGGGAAHARKKKEPRLPVDRGWALPNHLVPPRGGHGGVNGSNRGKT